MNAFPAGVRVWIAGGDFDAKDAGADSITERFERLAKKWAPRPRKPKATI